MANYRLPMDADGFKYHGTVDQNEENPGQFMYGLDENGNKRIIRTDEQGNVLTKVTGSNVEQFIERQVINKSNNNNVRKVPFGAKGFIFQAIIYDVTGTFDDGEGVRLRVFSLARGSYINRASVSDSFTNYTTDVGNLTISTQKEGGMSMSNAIEYKNYDTPILAPYIRFDVNVTGSFSGGEGIDLEVAIMWLY